MLQLDQALPPFAAAGRIVAGAAEALRPPKRVSVSEAAELHRHLVNRGGGYSGPWRNPMAPYLVEPMDRVVSRAIDMMVLIGPSQSAKTELLLNLICHAIKYRPADILVFQPTRDLALDFAERRVENGLINPSRDLRDQLGGSVSDGKMLTKTFRNGMMLSIAWPVSGQLASRPVPTVVFDERDSMPDDIDGEGDPVELGQRRTRTFGRNGKTVVISSPKRGNYSGILPLYDQGDQNLLHWPCVHCGDYYTPGFDADRQPTDKHLSDVGELACPLCGALSGENLKAAHLARAVWLPKGMSIARDGAISGVRPATRTASYWLSGMVVPFMTWEKMAAERRAAAAYYERAGDESKLKAFWNTTLGARFKSRLDDLAKLDPETLIARAEDFPLGVVPSWARAAICAVDVQGDRFEILWIAVGPQGETAVIDYRQLFKAIDLAAPNGERLIDPAHRAEDWDLLEAEVLSRRLTVDGLPGVEITPVMTGIDTHGAAGVTGQAYDFWLRLRAKELKEPGGMVIRGDKRVMLLRGSPRRDGPLVSQGLIEKDSSGKPLKAGIKLQTINVETLKDMVDSRLRRTTPGPGYIHLSKHLPRRFFDEATAEAKTAKGWEKHRPRNEAWDLLVYGLAVFVRLGGLRIDWNNPPRWALPPQAVSVAPVARAADQPAHVGDKAAARVGEATRPPAEPVGGAWIDSRSDWLRH